MDFADVFCATYGLPLHTTVPRVNRTSARIALEELDAATRETLTGLNDVDIEIYETVKARFESAKRAIFRRIAENRSTEELEPGTASIAATSSNAAPEAHKGPSPDENFAEICECRVQGPYGPGRPVRGGEIARIGFLVVVHEELPALTVGLEISDDVGEIVFATCSEGPVSTVPIPAGSRHLVTFAVKADIRHGRYHVGATLNGAGSPAMGGLRCFDRLASFDVIDGSKGTQIGYCELETHVHWERQEETGAPV